MPAVEEQLAAVSTYDLDWTQPEALDDDDVLRFVRNQYKAGKERRNLWEKEAAKQLAWCEGDQDLEWDANADLPQRLGELERSGIPLQYQHPVRINTLKGVIQQRIAFLIGGGVELRARPDDPNDDDDISIALIGTKLLRHLWNSGSPRMRILLINALWHMMATGVIWAQVFWDVAAGEPEPLGPDLDEAQQPEERQNLIDAFKRSVSARLNRDEDSLLFDDQGRIRIPPGEVRIRFVTGFDLTEPEYATADEDAEWLITTSWRHLEYFQARYGADVTEELRPAEVTAEYESDWRRLYDRYGLKRQRSDRVAPEQVQEHTLWRPVSAAAPRGALLIVAGNTVLRKGPHPYRHGRYPLVRIQELPSEGFRPPSTIGQMMTLQAARNRRRSMLDAALHGQIAPKLMVEEGVELEADALDAEDRIVRVPQGAIANNRIRWMEKPEIPRDVYQSDEMDRRDMMDLGTVHDSTTGRGESKSQSGRHAAILQRSDERGNFITNTFLTEALSEVGSQVLWLWYQFAATERVIRLSGPDQQAEALQFKGEDLLPKRRRRNGPGPGDFSVDCVVTPAMDTEQALAFSEVMVNFGVWNPANPEDRARIEKLLARFSNFDDSEDARQRRNASREHKRLSAGQRVPVRYGDDDSRHIEEHSRWTTTDEYAELWRKDAAIEQRVIQHITTHMVQDADKRNRRRQIETLVQSRLVAELGPERPQQPPAAPPGGNGRSANVTAGTGPAMPQRML